MPDGILPALCDIAAEAGALALASWRGEFKSWDKTPGSPVCDIDLSVNDLLRERLTALDGSAGWLSEETADDAARLSRRKLWVVDPIDGTRDYIRGRDGWAVSVALVEDGLVTAGVLAAPARDEMWRAAAGRGAFRNGQPIAVSPRDEITGARVPWDVLPPEDRDLVAVHKPNSIALRMAMVAAGEADFVATVRLGNEWDVAAAALIVSEAGGVVSDAHGRPFRFAKPDPRDVGLVASTPGIAQAVVRRLQPRLPGA